MMIRLHNIFDAISRLSMLLTIFMIPFFVVPVPWMTIAQSKMAIIVILLSVTALGWMIARLLEGTIRLSGRFILVAGTLLPLAYLVSTLITGATSLSLFGTGVEQDTLAAACIWFSALALSSLAFSENPLRSIDALRAFFLGSLVLVVLLVLHLFFPTALSFAGALTWQTGNLFGSWHDLAILLGFLAFLGTALVKSPAGEGVWGYLFAGLAAVSLLLLVVLNFFDVWIAVGSISLVFLIHRLIKSNRLNETIFSSLRRNALWVALILLSALFVFFGSFVNNALPSAVRISSLEVRPSWQGTFQVGQQVLVRPATLFFGAGPNTFTHEWGLYKPADINTTPFWNTDFSTGIGLIPTSFITVGIAGILAWLALFAALLWITWAILFGRSSSASSPLSMYGSVVEPLALATVFLFGFFVLYVPGPALSIIPFLSLGLLIALAGCIGLITTQTWSVRSGRLAGPARTLVILVFGFIVVYTGFGMGRVLASDAILNRGILLYNDSGDIAQASELVLASARISPESDRAQRAAVELGLLQLQKMIADADPENEESRVLLQTKISQTIEYALNAVSINSNDYQNWLALASLYSNLAGANVEGAYANARSAYSRAQAASPSNPLPFLQLAQLELLLNNSDAALRNLASAVQLKADFAPAYYLASQIYASKSDFKNAIPVAAQAAQYAQEDPLAWYNLGIIAYGGEDYTDAVTALKQAISLEPQYVTAIYVLGLSYYRQGMTQEALQAFTELNKLDPGQQTIVRFLEDLRAGKPLFPEESSEKIPTRK